MELTKNEKEAQQLILNEIQKAVDLLIVHSEKYCKNNQTQAIPMIVLKEFAKVLIKSLKKGANGQ